MKSSKPIIAIVALLLALITCNAFGADAAPQAATVSAPASSLWLSLIPFAVPVLVMFVKGLLPSIPKPWLPVIAAAVGLLLAVFDHFTGSLGGNPMAVLFLGAAGTGLREIGDQLKQLVTA